MRVYEQQPCPLCNGTSMFYADIRGTRYLKCQICEGIFVHQDHLLDPDAEMAQYNVHINDVHDPRYQNFVSPITTAILADFDASAKGLDFGSGTGPVIAMILQDNKYHVTLYDPFFHADASALEARYDYIACCEVIEHFYKPIRDFALLKRLLEPQGKLYCMTEIYKPNMYFPQWGYKNDTTHVFFYARQTLQWIKDYFEFSDMQISNRLVVYTN